ncbi:MAG: ATP-binding protein [Candidatus Niyogibacteria bacterium]|nr:ATP-binding protein [Candidatus Niyogibacteria bacterium]
MRTWLEEFELQVKAGSANTFHLYRNVWDHVLLDDDFLRPYEVIPKTDAARNAAIIAFFNLGSGMRFPQQEMKQLFFLFIQELADADPIARGDVEIYFESNKRNISEVLLWFEMLVSCTREEIEELVKARDPAPKVKSLVEKKRPAKNKKCPSTIIVFEYQESKTPIEAASGTDHIDRRVWETIQWWAQYPPIKETRNLILLLSRGLGGVAKEFADQSLGIIPIEVPLPRRENLEEAVGCFKKKGIFVPVKGTSQDLTEKEIAKQSVGISYVELEQIFRQAQVHKERLTSQILFEKKGKIIEDRLGGIVQIEKPPWSWDHLGGMNHHISLFMPWVDALRKGNISGLPKGGWLLIGPPGTGKTVSAEVIAHEADMVFLKLKNTFNKFVGESEERMQLLLKTALDLHPCMLWIDEIEGLFLKRGEVYHGDSGVFARTSRMFMDFSADTQIHGKVIIIAATNRPDLMDSAVLRSGRWGVKIPYLIPQKKDRPSIWKALLRKEMVRLSLADIALDISDIINDELLIQKLSDMADFWDKDGELVCGPPDFNKIPDKKNVIALTGAEMEDIIGLSFQHFFSDEEAKAMQNLRGEELFSYIQEHLSKEDTAALSGEMLVATMEHHLPHQEVAEYRKMNDMALAAANDDRLIPLEYRKSARRLRIEKQHQAIPTL